ncbi:MAG TPA: hypothetical protein VFG32_00935 [Bacteroidota bacterium]|nr:hypothetical protein [Bacteroidota bacterium]
MPSMLTRLRRLKKRFDQINEIAAAVDELRKAIGHLEARLTRQELAVPPSLHDYEFKVYSQWGEDGIIQYLINSIEISNKVFVEFGVQDYREANTRFLLQCNNWSGLVMDSSPEFIQRIRSEPLYFRHNLRAICAFIDRDNINQLLKDNGITGDIGLLSIDIDGMDYWIWEAISSIHPRIVVCEYDSLMGSQRAVVTPYDGSFDRLKAHYSFLYGGASIAAIDMLARRKGYSLVGSNSNGVNAFFVRNDLVGTMNVLTPQQAYVRGQFRNSRDQEGNMTYLGFDDAVRLIADMPLLDVEKDTLIKVRDVHNL